ncbi:MAG: hypothetical protein COZ17_11510 [Flavobacteriaceae bacterium CG_4_10_14_3_um_filter_33_47]|nr:MAG: hypothetical protein COZ17_11510 [Flavobacteriaceae bacterium CG_4_10_14_3_um_filter_33_47]PJB18191.1 MAG: hypothetical protein CO117_08900 [Flavobacteriaceae bacterium CG_4_9_14_3_um_filter_33_16]
MNLKRIFNSILILVFRLLDLYTTHIATPIDFANQEQNFLVKDLGLSKTAFFVEEVIFAFLLIAIYLLSIKKNEIFRIKANTFSSYLKTFFFNKKEKNKFIKYFGFYSLKKTFYLYGTIIPQLYITTSIILALNNYWVYLLVNGIKTAATSYRYLNKIYVIDFIIFDLPVILLFVFMYHKLKVEYRKNNVFA